MAELTYGDLFDFVAKKVNFRGATIGRMTWNCNGRADRPFLNEFFTSNSVDDETKNRVTEIMNQTGGYCDCEILFNSQHGFPRDILLSETDVDSILARRDEGVKVVNKECKRLHKNAMARDRRRIARLHAKQG